MAIGTLTALGIGLSAASSIGGAAIASSGANRAANAQAQAADRAAQLQYQAQQQALAEQRRQFDIAMGNLSPWLNTGGTALANLAYLMGLPASQTAAPAQGTSALSPTRPITPQLLPPGGRGRPGTLLPMEAGTDGVFALSQDAPPQVDTSGENPLLPGATTTTAPDVDPRINPNLGEFGSLMAPWTQEFTAPDAESLTLDPSYQFRLREGMRALENSAAARGGLLTGATAQAIGQYSQDMASTEYSNAYQRALQEYQQSYNIFRQNQATQFNQLASLAGAGQTAAGQLTSAGQNQAGQISNILLTGAAQQGNALQNAAAARGSGYVGAGNVWANTLGQLGTNITDLLLRNG